jgi:hypothetical protein
VSEGSSCRPGLEDKTIQQHNRASEVVELLGWILRARCQYHAILRELDAVKDIARILLILDKYTGNSSGNIVERASKSVKIER